MHENQGNLEEAKALLLECEKIHNKVFGDEHETTQDARERAATVGDESDSEVYESEEQSDSEADDFDP